MVDEMVVPGSQAMNNSEDQQTQVPPVVVEGKKDKKWIVALLLSIFVGVLGIDRFYLGYVWQGILKLITGGGLGVWWLIDFILIAKKHEFGKVNWIH